MKYRIVAAAPLIILLASACSGGPSAAERTLVAQNELLATQIVDVRSTATVDADRLRVTADYAQTAIAQAQVQNQRLSGTIAALGGNAAAVSPRMSSPTPPPDGMAVVPEASVEVGAATTDSAVMAATATPAPPTLYNLVTARGVGSNDCALAPVSNFTTADTEIYVVATAANIQPGTTLMSRWFYEGQEVVVYDFTPDFAIAQNCIWFFIDSTETTFTPGNWTVQLELNGQVVGEPVAFSISE